MSARASIIAVLALLAALVAPWAAPARADATYVVVAEDGLHLRACPGLDCAIFWTMPAGEVVGVAGGWDGAWLEVSDGGAVGWADADWLAPSDQAPAAAPAAPEGTCFDNTWGQVVCAPGWISDDVAAAAAYYGQNYDAMMAVAACESNFDPGEVTGDAVGLFQFLPSTFYDWSSGDVWSVSDQAWTAARMWAEGQAWQWDCYGRI